MGLKRLFVLDIALLTEEQFTELQIMAAQKGLGTISDSSVLYTKLDVIDSPIVVLGDNITMHTLEQVQNTVENFSSRDSYYFDDLEKVLVALNDLESVEGESYRLPPRAVTEIFEDYSNSWVAVKNNCRLTVGKKFTESEPSDKFKKALLISEHSPIRFLNFNWIWKGIKYWVSTEWSRHKFEKFITSQRNDRQSNYDRNEARQDSLVNFAGLANMQNLIDAWRKRLCRCATVEARLLAEDFKTTLHKKRPFEADVLVPNCVYRCGCPEMTECKFFQNFKEKAEYAQVDITNIQARYDFYNKGFYNEK